MTLSASPSPLRAAAPHSEPVESAAPSATAIIAACACTKPQPPQLTPKEAKVTSVDISGFDLRVKMEAVNPNGIDLSVRSVVAKVIE